MEWSEADHHHAEVSGTQRWGGGVVDSYRPWRHQKWKRFELVLYRELRVGRVAALSSPGFYAFA